MNKTDFEIVALSYILVLLSLIAQHTAHTPEQIARVDLVQDKITADIEALE